MILCGKKIQNKKEKKKKLIPFKTGSISLKLYTADYCIKNGFQTSSFTSQQPNTTDNKNKNNTLDIDDLDMTLPTMSAREAMSHIHSKPEDNKNEEKEKGGNKNKKCDKQNKKGAEKGGNINKKASKQSLFEKAMSHYDAEFEPQNKNNNNESIQTNIVESNSTLSQNVQSSDPNQLLLNLIELLKQTQTNNNNVQLPLQTDNKKDVIIDKNEKDCKLDKKLNETGVRKGYMGRTIMICDEWKKKSDIALVARCKKLNLVKNSSQLDTEKRKIKFLAVNRLKIAREDHLLSTRKWRNLYMPINEATKKRWTFDDAVKSDIVQTINDWTPPDWIIFSRKKASESKTDDPSNSQIEKQTNAENGD
eukprot:265389_1